MSDHVPAIAGHGAAVLPSVTVDGYNAELRSKGGMLGDRASNRAFRAILEDGRASLRRRGADPLGEEPSADISKKAIDKALVDGPPEAGGLVLGAVEEFAQELALIVRRFLRLKAWRGTERIAVGGGMSGSRVGVLAIGRAGVLLKAAGLRIELAPIRHDPDEAGLIGCAHLAPSWLFAGHDAILAVDIGGTNIRAGVVQLRLDAAADLSKARVLKFELWRHRDDEPRRDEAVERLNGMLKDLVKWSRRRKHRLAPFVGVACPGLIAPDGAIRRGGQNLPGDWHARRFNLAERIGEALPRIDEHAVCVVLHNDAVVQGLSQAPFMQDVKRWGVLTIGTGLGNARFTNLGDG